MDQGRESDRDRHRGGRCGAGNVDFPAGVWVVVRDYDVEGCDESDLTEDEERRPIHRKRVGVADRSRQRTMNEEETEPLISSLNGVVGQKRAVRFYGPPLMPTSMTASRPALRERSHMSSCAGRVARARRLLAEIVSRECCANCHTELAQNIANPGQMQGLLMMLEAGDILFLDEIHELSSAGASLPLPCVGGGQAVSRPEIGRRSACHRSV